MDRGDALIKQGREDAVAPDWDRWKWVTRAVMNCGLWVGWRKRDSGMLGQELMGIANKCHVFFKTVFAHKNR